MNLKRGLACIAAMFISLPILAEDPLKVGFVYVGPIGDHGWSYQHDQGRLALEEHFGGKVETIYIENVNEGADAERAIRRMAQAGSDVIFTTSFGFMNPTVRVAEQYPDKTFLHATGYKQADNLGTYLSLTYEGRSVTGTAAGLVTETNTIGFIGSFPIPEVIRDINALFLAARKVNPEVELKIVWVNTWFDPAKEADAAGTLIDQGADVIVQHTDSPAAMITAEKRGVWAVGQASDMSHFGPKAHLLSVVNNWAPYYIKTVDDVLAGTWVAEDHWGGIGEGLIKIVGVSERLSEDHKAKIDAVIKSIASGELKPFKGPLKDQSGKVRVAEGETMSKEALAGMDWFVEGISASLPK